MSSTVPCLRKSNASVLIYEQTEKTAGLKSKRTFHVKHEGARMIKGVIFDYNNTLYFDMDIAKAAFRQLFKEAGCDESEFEDFYTTICRSPSSVAVKLLSEFAGREFSKEEARHYTGQIDVYYQQGCIDMHRDRLAEGAEELFDYLIRNGYKINICTATVDFSVDFYFRNTRLDRWFKRELVANDDGHISNKVEMYRKAAERIGVEAKDCLVFEDSPKGIEDAMKAGFKQFVYVNHYHNPSIGLKEILQEIEDFTQLDYSIFER